MRADLPHRRRAVIFGVMVPAGIYALSAAAILAVRDRIPAEVVVHIGPSGVRMGSPLEVLATLGVLSGVGSLVLAGLSLRIGRTSMSRRMVLGIATGWAALMAGIGLAFLLPQVFVQSGGVSFEGPLAVACLIAVAAGGLAAAYAGNDPRRPASEPVPDDAPRAGSGAAPLWQQRVGVPRRVRPWLWLLGVLYAGVAVAVGAGTGSWLFAALLLAAMVPPAMMLNWRVRVDAGGLTATAGLPGKLAWPRQHVPADEVLRADAVQVDPFGEFGGWGLRTAPDQHGTVGVVVRKGPGIAVRRTGGRRFVVTLPDAEAGAALLNTMADRAREPARSA